MIEVVGGSFRDWFTVYVWRALLDMLSFWGPVVAFILACVVLAGIVYLWWKILIWVHSGPRVGAITLPFLIPVAVTGFVLELLLITKLYQKPNVETIFTAIAGVELAIVLALAGKRICGFDCSLCRKLGFALISILFILQALLLGMTAFCAVFAVIAVVIAIAIAAGIAGGGVKSMMSGSGSNDRGGSVSDIKVLEDGTEIKNFGFGTWRDTTTGAPYKENFDGTFSRK